LLEAIREHLGDRVEVTGDGAGAHIVLWPERRTTEDALVAAAAARGVGMYGVGRYFLRRAPRVGIMLGYPRMRETDIREGVRRLAEIL
jgi:GntR family transcriptional regulator/MocR family aminotransferase